jgi:phytoene synthase
LGSNISTDNHALTCAYEYCKEITRINSRTFYAACNFLSPGKRQAVHALYAFCRSTDDLVDKARQTTNHNALFANWRSRLANHHPSAHDPVPLAWADAQARYSIPRGYADQLIDGITRDLRQTRYESFEELTEYCYGVASTVGLMSMHVIGFRDEKALPYAVKLGIALQLTNILRDVGEDWRAGRLYLPQDELDRFGLNEADVEAGRIDDRWRAFMRFQIARARQLYDEAQSGIRMLDPDGRFAIAAAATLYRAILERIEANDYDVIHHRAYVSTWGKVRRLPTLWWRTQEF